MGFVVSGGSRITGSGSKLFARALEAGGAGGPGAGGGTMSSGSKKYMHLVGNDEPYARSAGNR
jgi:hypothetical protein